jgi:hypothetical protein
MDNFSLKMKNHKSMNVIIRKAALLLLLSFTIAAGSFAQTKWNQYYFVFPENAFYRDSYQSSIIPNAEVKVASSVAKPKNLGMSYFSLSQGNDFPPLSDSITTYQLTANQMWASYCQLTASGTENAIKETTYSGKSSKAVKVAVADTPISVYAMTQVSTSSDVSNVLEERELGTDYYQIGYKAYDQEIIAKDPYNAKSGYIIVATKYGTNISVNGVLVKAGLDAGDVYCRYRFSGDLTGDHITTNYPVAFFSMTTMAQIPVATEFNDMLFQQLPPTNQWGRNFIIPMPAQLMKQHIRVLAIQNGTTLTVSGASIITQGIGEQLSYDNLNEGQFVEFELTNPNGAFISSNKQVGVCAYLTGASNNGGIGDPSQVWIPPVAQRDNAILASAFVPKAVTKLTKHYFIIITPTATKNQTTVDDNLITGATWIDVANSGYSFCQYSPNKTSTCKIGNPQGVIVHGLGLGEEESYYYVTGSGHRDITSVYTISGTVSGLTNNAGIAVNYTVNGGTQQSVNTESNGTYTISNIPYDANVVITASAQPGYTANVASSPSTSNITANVTGKNITYNICDMKNVISAPSDVCAGNSIKMNASINDGTWSSLTPSIATIDAITGIVTGVSAGIATVQYTVTQNDCTTTATAQVTVNAKRNHSVTISASDNNTCHGTCVIFTANSINSGSSPSYQWKKNGVNVNGANKSTYTYFLDDGDVITCEVSSNDDCVTPLTATSNSVKMVELGDSTPSIKISIKTK